MAQIQEPMLGPAPSAPSPLEKRPIEENTQQSRPEGACSGAFSPTEPLGGSGESGGALTPRPRAASDRALWRVRLVAFRVFRRVRRGRARVRAASDRALWRVRLVAFKVFRRVRRARTPRARAASDRALWRRGTHPKSARGIRPSFLEGGV